MDLRIDPDSPVPRYHQIAEAIRYRISTGALRAGAPLPPLRAAADRWGVNLHTVRRAYGVLAEMGLVRIKRPTGAIVLAPGRGGGTRIARKDKLAQFLDRVLRQAREKHGLSPLELARLLALPPATASARRVAVVECSETQCADLAGQLERRWNVTADPWCLARTDDLPEGEVIATYFHYNDVRRRWPDRLGGVHFIAIHPDPDIPQRVAARCRRGRPHDILVCERDPTMLAMILADLSNLFRNRRYRLIPHLKKATEGLPAPRDKRLILASPRVWGGLSPAERADARVLEIRYVFDADQIERLAVELDWTPQHRGKEQSA